MLNGVYFEMIRAQSNKTAGVKQVYRPDVSCAVGTGERLGPQTIPIIQQVTPTQRQPVKRANKNRDQYENIKMLLPVTVENFPFEGGGFR